MSTTSKVRSAGFVVVVGVTAWMSVAACGGGIPSAAPSAAPATDDPYAESEATAASATSAPSPPVSTVASSAPIVTAPTSETEACTFLGSSDRAKRSIGLAYLRQRNDQILADATVIMGDLRTADASCKDRPAPDICSSRDRAEAVRQAKALVDRATALKKSIDATAAVIESLPASCWGPGLIAYDFDGAVGELKSARETADRYIAKKKADDDDRAARVKAVEDMKTATTSCERDLTACKTTCAKSVAAYECVFIAMLYSTGDKRLGISSPDYRKAIVMFDAACSAGTKYACAGKDIIRDESKACSGAGCEPYCTAGFGGSCVIRGEELRDDKKFAAAAAWFQKGCDANDGMSCNDLGSAYFMGEGVGTNRAKAETLFKKACDLAQAEIDAIPAERSVPPMVLARRDTSCRNYEGTVCVNKVQAPAQRRPGKDDMCRKLTGRGTAWATLDGTDSDECMNAMMNRGCQEAMGLKAYCCPSN